MKKISLAIVLTIMAAILVNKHFTVNVDETNAAVDKDDARHIAWCDGIYHQNPSCPKYGQVVVPPAVLAQQEADHLAWCDGIYHQNVGCPKYGQVIVPPAVRAEQEADFNAWCDRIHHRNVSCPKYGW